MPTATMRLPAVMPSHPLRAVNVARFVRATCRRLRRCTSCTQQNSWQSDAYPDHWPHFEHVRYQLRRTPAPPPNVR
jgi:hypothetical protein